HARMPLSYKRCAYSEMTKVNHALSVIMEKRRIVLRSAICVLSLVFVWGFYFIGEFVANFFLFAQVKDSSLFELISVLLFLGVAGASFVQLISGFVFRKRPAGDQICRILVVVGACVSPFYRGTPVLLADKAFFWAYQRRF